MIDSGMQAVLAQLVVLRVVMQVHVVWMQRCLYKAGEKWACRERMFGLERTLEPGGHGAGPLRRRRYRVEESYDGSDETALLDEAEKMMTSTTYWKGVPGSQRSHSLEIIATKELVRSAARAHKIKSDNRNYPVKLAATPWRRDLVPVVNEDAKCPKRLCPWSRAVMAWFGNDAGSAACRAHLVATNLVARDENVGVENKFSRLWRFVLKKSLQTKRVDVSGMQQFWVGLTTRVSWLFGKEYAKLYPDEHGVDAFEQEIRKEKKQTQETRTRKIKAYSAHDAYMREQRPKGSSSAEWQSMEVIMKGYKLLKRANLLGPYTRRAAQATVRRQMGDPNPWGDWPGGPPEPPSTTALVVAVPIEDLVASPTVHIAGYPAQAIPEFIS